MKYASGQPKQTVVCVCHAQSIKLLNVHEAGKMLLLQEVKVFTIEQNLTIADCILPPKMGGELLVATSD